MTKNCYPVVKMSNHVGLPGIFTTASFSHSDNLGCNY